MPTTANTSLPGGANSPLYIMNKTDYELGLIVDQDNLLDSDESDRNAIADVLAGILGTYNCQVADFPVAINVEGLSFTVGGRGQKLFVQGRLVDNVVTQGFTAGASGVANRIDGLFVKYNLLSTSGREQTVVDGGGEDTDVTVPNNYESVTWSYIAGTPGGSIPTTPAGYEAFASILVAAGSSVVVPTILFPTVTQQLLDNNVVTSLNTQNGALTLVEGPHVSISSPEPGQILIGLGGGLVVSVNELAGEVLIAAGLGVAIATTGGEIVVSSADTFTGDGVEVTTTGNARSINIPGGGTSVEAGNGVSVAVAGSIYTVSAKLSEGSGVTLTTESDGTIQIAAVETGVGYSAAVVEQAGVGTSPITATLNLPSGGTYFIESIGHGIDWSASHPTGQATLTLAGLTGGSVTSGIAQTDYTRTLYAGGVAPGGATITASISFDPTIAQLLTNTTSVFLSIKAIRIS